MAGVSSQREVASAVSGVWEKFRGATLDRVGAIEGAVRALAAGELGVEQRRDAEREAHRLAGAVGTFGFPRGSEIAREIETILQGEGRIGEEGASRLGELVKELRAELERAAPASPAETRARLLVIDRDALFTRQIVSEAEGRGITVRVVDGPVDAAAALSTEHPDAIVLDPSFSQGESGLRLLAEITTRAPSRPVIVASTAASLTDRVEAARFGARAYFQKPASPVSVVDAALRALRRTTTVGRVLTVDDDPRILESVRGLLEPTGLEVVALDDPRNFWEVLETVRPDLLLLDVDMPEVSGVELCRVVRNDARWATLPVIFLTARTDAETLHAVFAAGADDFVAKPMVGPELTTRINNRLERVRLYRLLADTDALTGVANRRRSAEAITELIESATHDEQPVALGMIDLDFFKGINDRFGHAAGDDVLRRVANGLRNALRAEDVVGRWGGEEFVVAARGVDKALLAHRISGVLDTLRAERVHSGKETLPLTFSAGVAGFPEDGATLDEVCRAADLALYQAKAHGRQKVVKAGSTSYPGAEATVDVVLVEDDVVLGEALVQAVSEAGYSMHWIQDGNGAVDKLVGPEPAIRARLLLLDLNLPGQDGLVVLQKLSRTGITRDTSVVMLTSRTTRQSVVRSLHLGAVDYIAKPVAIETVIARARQALGDVQGA